MDHAQLLDYEQFVHILRSLGAQMHHAQAVHTSILEAWDESHRTFHTKKRLSCYLYHLEQERWGGLIEGPDRGRLAFALWFCRAVCLPKTHNNEELSAKKAMSAMHLLGISQTNINAVNELILCSQPGRAATTPLQLWMQDIVYSVLGLPYSQFAQESVLWRKELSWVDDLNYRRGTDIMLKRFIHEPTIFKTQAGQLDYEENANYNISQALQSLHHLEVTLRPPSM